MVTTKPTRGIANPDDCASAVSIRGRLDEPDLTTAVQHLEIESAEVAVRQGRIAFGPVVASVLARKGVDEDTIALYAHLNLIVDLQPDIALSLSPWHVIACHSSYLEPSVR
jgi:hypothetical protein